MTYMLTKEDIESIKTGKYHLIDVRTAEEVAQGNIKFAQNWDLQLMTAGKLPNIQKSEPVYVFCRSGARSAEAQRLLSGAGFTNSHDLGSLTNIPQELV